MRSEDLTFGRIFDAAIQGGVHQFGGVRAIIIDAAIVGMSRRALLEALGATDTKRLILRLGYAQGWRAAASLSGAVDPLTPARVDEIVQRLLALLGFAQASSARLNPHPREPTIILADSCEAEEYARHCGTSQEPVCWFASGFTSGYLSRATARPVVSREDRCVILGHEHCRLRIEIPVHATLDLSAADPFAADAAAHLLGALTAHDPSRASVASGDGREPEALPLGMQSPSMRELAVLATRAAKSDCTVLITGETGVGKEQLAKFIHERSTRARAPFIPVNCGAFAQGVLESELFGHRRGAFTGANEDRPGLFEAAHGGTILLDEIGEMPLDMQVRLLRVLQEREVRRIGDIKPKTVDVLVIAATNRRLSTEVSAGRFRADLLYRLDVVAFEIPPLRERPVDLRALVDRLLVRASKRQRRGVLGYTPTAVDALMSYHWPGNIRELENVIARACALSTGGLIGLGDLPARFHDLQAMPAALAPERPLRDVERAHIFSALRRHHDDKVLAADELGISLATLYRKLKRYGIHLDFLSHNENDVAT